MLKDEAGKGTNKYKLARKAFRLGMEKRVPAGPRRRAELERLRRNRGQTRRAPAGLAPVCVRAAAPGWLVLESMGQQPLLPCPHKPSAVAGWGQR